jgi:hypothetical protein
MTSTMLVKFNILSLVCEYDVGENPIEVAKEMYAWVMEGEPTKEKAEVFDLRPVQ